MNRPVDWGRHGGRRAPQADRSYTLSPRRLPTGRRGGVAAPSGHPRGGGRRENGPAQIRAAGGEAEFFPCDVSSAAANEVLVAHVVATPHGCWDFAHNNAGITVHRLLHETSDEEFDRIIAVNLRGTFLGMKHQIKQMLGQEHAPWASRSERSAVAAWRCQIRPRAARARSRRDAGAARSHCDTWLDHRPAGGQRDAWSATASSTARLTKNAAVEYAYDGIRVNAVCPGPIMTPRMSDFLGAPARDPLPAGDDPLGKSRRRGASAVVWLGSQEASFVTGVALPWSTRVRSRGCQRAGNDRSPAV